MEELKKDAILLAQAIYDIRCSYFGNYIYECPHCKVVSTKHFDDLDTHAKDCIVHKAKEILDKCKS